MNFLYTLISSYRNAFIEDLEVIKSLNGDVIY